MKSLTLHSHGKFKGLLRFLYACPVCMLDDEIMRSMTDNSVLQELIYGI